MDDRSSMFSVIRFSDPHGLKSRQRAQNGATYPWQKLPFRRAHDTDLGAGRDQGL